MQHHHFIPTQHNLLVVEAKIVHKNINTYAIPSDLNLVLSVLFGIGLSSV